MRQENSFKVNVFMVHMIVLTEVFIIFKHGRNDFSHASIPTLGYVYMGVLITIFLTIFFKVLISDIINKNICLKVAMINCKQLKSSLNQNTR